MGSRFGEKQLITGEGIFDAEVLNNLVKVTKLNECSLNYAVVAIMGPQSSGKSTLLNALFGTNFKEMDATKKRQQMTKGIWVADWDENIIFDIEGTDGQERGQDDVIFERQSTLFALAVTDILIINMSWKDVGRVSGANRPLMKTVFQVMVDSFITSRKRTLLFTIRDKSPKVERNVVEDQLKEFMDTIWAEVKIPEAHKKKQLSNLFHIEVYGLSNYETQKEEFLKEVDELKKLFLNSTSTKGLASDRRDVVPASSFPFSAQELWKTIKENKQLDLPSHKVLVAIFHCEETLKRFKNDEGLLKLLKEIDEGRILNVQNELSSILEKYISAYDKDTFNYDGESEKNNNRQDLESKALEFVYPKMSKMLSNLSSTSLDNFKTMLENSLDKGKSKLFEESVRRCMDLCMDNFDKGCQDAEINGKDWDAPNLKEKLKCQMYHYKSSFRSSKLTGIVSDYKKNLFGEVREPIGDIFYACKTDNWDAIRKLLCNTTNNATSKFSNEVAIYELTMDEESIMLQSLRDYAKNLVEEEARTEAGKIYTRMEERFWSIYKWNEDLTTDLKSQALAESFKALSTMVAIRLEDKPNDIDSNVSALLMETGSPLITSLTWDQVSVEETLISPAECYSLWKQFLTNVQPLIERNENLIQRKLEYDSEMEKLKQQINKRKTISTSLDIASGALSMVACIVPVLKGSMAGIKILSNSEKIARAATAMKPVAKGISISSNLAATACTTTSASLNRNTGENSDVQSTTEKLHQEISDHKFEFLRMGLTHKHSCNQFCSK